MGTGEEKMKKPLPCSLFLPKRGDFSTRAEPNTGGDKVRRRVLSKCF